MEPDDGQHDRAAIHDARIVEISTALFLGIVVLAVPNVAVWVVGLILDVRGTGWATIRRVTFAITIVVGAVVAIWWLLRARRRGL